MICIYLKPKKGISGSAWPVGATVKKRSKPKTGNIFLIGMIRSCAANCVVGRTSKSRIDL